VAEENRNTFEWDACEKQLDGEGITEVMRVPALDFGQSE
jgi:hypothetical protein